jgi:hypothetical protein
MSWVEMRKICWPKPDAVCMQGGCGYCNDYPYRGLGTIERYARENGLIKDFRWGESHLFCNAMTTKKWIPDKGRVS